jgi:hypothetical protein
MIEDAALGGDVVAVVIADGTVEGLHLVMM